MVNLTTTEPILAAYEAIPASARHTLALPSALQLADPISHAQLIQVARYFRTNPPPPSQDASSNANTHPESDPRRNRTLNTLLRGTKVYVPPPPPKPEPTKEYLAHKARLLAAAEADAYNRMTSPNPTPHFHPSFSIPGSVNPIFTSSTPLLSALHDKHAPPEKETITPSLVLNIFLSVLITGFSVFWALHVWTPGGPGGIGAGGKVLAAMGAALGVGAVEAGIYAIYLRKMRVARGREQRVREVKVSVGREEVGGGGKGGGKGGEGDGNDVAAAGTGVKEEIWGRGVNGGVRRRVRERWEEKEKDMDMDKQDAKA
ncbi:hypothetical protein ASPACDRAFT_1853776 [Aspergillus aculeatus ATCC 16872]|uniref:ATPase, vacuolar ER assembly factor, Vma12 n=1 Tax=Aspergillus aculeatus (strain ATCC 16872 / CBS 172.66 / WB 5094) TaxID=690307 RepID=A0A1L9X438_ASPA1|nr:uncharacterized protein ASPACDRAFT_1853776 [Aspergillus aculeatus ATCC 16872]OJK03211.1 hypothetical protein ASPACDRAFT_1853776 [Aspergillus aculeatus ATCC 16872]